VELDWSRNAAGNFREAVGNALWSSKWSEVKSGEPWPDLQQQSESGKVKGTWPEARDHWGSFSKKLEVALVLRLGSKENRDPRRLVPGVAVECNAQFEISM
jgi:hypothetical protein